jgi:hypothetical protein
MQLKMQTGVTSCQPPATLLTPVARAAAAQALRTAPAATARVARPGTRLRSAAAGLRA